MKQQTSGYFLPALRIYFFLTLLLGLAFPVLITGLAQLFFPDKANGSLVSRGDQVVGSRLIAQKFEKEGYFWPRPSAVDYNPLPSGGSNLSPIAENLKKAVEERKAKLKAAHAEETKDPPPHLLFASASGLDPHISVDSALFQVQRVARARGVTVEKVQELIDEATQGRQFGIFGEATVNVLMLNMALDREQESSR